MGTAGSSTSTVVTITEQIQSMNTFGYQAVVHMLECRGHNRNDMITGSSVHNQQIGATCAAVSLVSTTGYSTTLSTIIT